MKLLITGGSRGIGKAIALEAAKAGHELLLVSKNSANLDKGLDEIKSISKASVDSFVCDVGKVDDLVKLHHYCQSSKFMPSVLVLCAGIFFEDTTLMNCTPEQFEATLNVNFMSIHYTVKLFIDHLKTIKSSKIILIGSTAAYESYPLGAIYGVGKWALRGYAINLRKELMNDYVGVTFISPGGTLTDLWAGEPLPEDRLLEPSDIGKLVVAMLTLSSQAVVEELIVRPMIGDIHE
ncbi:MAG: Sepiapterin reductase [Anaerolineales bacterium]|nr:Sepiapterin reductase [Anaerolineales bacterium]